MVKSFLKGMKNDMKKSGKNVENDGENLEKQQLWPRFFSTSSSMARGERPGALPKSTCAKWGVPQNGWFRRENPLKIWMI